MKRKLVAVSLMVLSITFALATSEDDCYKLCKKKLRDCIEAGGYPPTCNDAYNRCIASCE
jgi:uncharacterized protein YgiB involved in biofilm formation